MKHWKNRPKWAKELDINEWNHLCVFVKGPTLKGTNCTITRQRENNIKCFVCESIGRKLFPIKDID